MHAENYIVIQGWMITELNLSGNDLLVYAIIYQFSQDGESNFSGSLQYLADWCNATKHGIMKNLKNLLDRELIVKNEDMRNGVKFVTYHVTKLHTMKQSYTNNRNISNNLNNSNNTNKQQELFNNKEVLEVRKNERGQWFVDTYNSICVSLPQCKRLNAKRTKAIGNILKKYSEEEILEVFNNLENSDFCTGKNDSGWKADIDFLLKEDKFDRILEGRYNNRKRGCKAETISPGQKYRVSAEEKEEMRKAVERGELKEY